jgi:hypothetical protein
VVDYELDLFAAVAAALDRYAASLLEARDPELADQLGISDAAEHAAGLGFVAGQAYLTTTCGFLRIKKDIAFKLGPPLSETGRPIAEIVNAAANHWKHSAEWPPREDLRQRREELFGLLGCSDRDDYPLLTVLANLTPSRDAPLSSLVSLLAAWRDSLDSG